MSKIKLLLQLASDLAKSKKHVVYVAGKVTGLDPAYVQAKFNISKLYLEEMGFHVICPVDFMDNDCDWNLAMRRCLILIGIADSIYLQADWEDSDGANVEYQLAIRIGMNVMFEK